MVVLANERGRLACWSCGEMRAAHFCTACGKVQPPAPADYFTFFGLPRKLDSGRGRSGKRFYELSRKLHPDLYGTADAREQEWSLEQTSQLNDAYRTLKDPDRADPVFVAARGRRTRRAIEGSHRKGALDGRDEETGRAAGSLGGCF